MNAHSSILGGSTAARLLACPASHVEQLKQPAIAEVESSYAAEGTAFHAAIASCIENAIPPKHILNGLFYGHVMTQDRIDVLQRALETLTGLLKQYGDPKRFHVVGIEETLALPNVTGAFGSVDLIMADKKTVVICDWKFGSGIKVSAVYQDADGDQYMNPQLAFYATAARDRHRAKFKDRRIVVAIVQPRLDEPLSYTETTDEELDEFLLAFRHAFIEAMGREPHRERGEHCRFAPCKATCPLWVGPVLDLSILDIGKEPLKASVEPTTDYGNFLSRALDLAELAEGWVDEIRRQSHVFLESGGRIGGWKVVPKRGTRQWIDPTVAPAELAVLGALSQDIHTQPELRSVAQVEKALKARGIALPGDLYQTVSSGTTIARDDDPRPTVTHADVTDGLREALKSL